MTNAEPHDPRPAAELQLGGPIGAGGDGELAGWLVARSPGGRQRILVISDTEHGTVRLLVRVGRAIARHGLGVLTVDLGDASEGPGLTDVAAGRPFSRTVMWDDDLDVAHLRGGRPRTEHPESLAKVAHRLPRDVDVLLVAEDPEVPLPLDEVFDAIDLVVLLVEDPLEEPGGDLRALSARISPLPFVTVTVPPEPAERELVDEVWRDEELSPPPSSDLDVDPADVWGPPDG